MGLNISLYRVIDMDNHKFEEDRRFDDIRYGGDREFCFWMSDNSIGISCKHQFCCDWIFSRPTDFEQARTWVKENVFEEGQKRFLDALEWMEADKDLWFYFGW